MAGRKRKNARRRRRSGLAPLYRLVCPVLIVAAIAVALALFFKAENLSVSGNSRYSSAQVMEASEVEVGENLFFLNKYEVARRISAALPYVESVSIHRTLPDTLNIHISECVCGVALEQEGKVWVLCQTGKIVGCQTGKMPEGYTVVTGVTLAAPEMGTQMASAEGSEAALEQLKEILSQLRKKGMLGNVQSIDLTQSEKITLRYLDRLNVELPWNADLDYKFDFLAAVVAKLEDYETGTLKMMNDGEARLVAG